MTTLRESREARKISQRRMAKLADVSFRSVQLVESGRHDPRISTLRKLSKALGYPPHIMERQIESVFRQPPDSIAMISERVVEEGERSWKIRLFNFVDAFRAAEKKEPYLEAPPVPKTPDPLRALLASTAESLCEEARMAVPEWCDGVPALSTPWFVSGIENLKAAALMESPVHFRKRNIFVLGNFLERK